MEEERSIKRRRLDTPPATDTQSNAPRFNARPKLLPPPGSNPTSDREASVPAPLTANGSTPLSTQEVLRRAKAQSRARKGRKLAAVDNSTGDSRTDVYDDFDRALPRQSPLKKNAAASATPAKKQLDPLRNQKAVEQSLSPSKSHTPLDFFKRFTTPKKDVAASGAELRTEVDGRSTDGSRALPTPMQKERTSIEEQQGSIALPNGAYKATETTALASSSVKRQRWTYDQPKKTFEDEIRELEDVARRQVDQEDDEDGPSGALQTRRKRTSTTKELAHGNKGAAVEKKTLKSSKPSVTRPTAAKMTKQKEATTASISVAHLVDTETVADAGDTNEGDVQFSAPPVRDTIMIETKSQPIAKAKVVTKDCHFTDKHLRRIQSVILGKLTGKRPIRLVNLDDEYAKLSTVITQTITAGESNSMLVIGARGTGKSALANQILRQQASEHPDDFHVVRLNGFIHTDDKIALRDIWRQLGREMELEDDENESKNYADTMSRLLALLSHPAEQGRELAGRVTKSVIFVLDEFELFANHPRQTLLYNLFDIAQSRKAPIAVLGLTTRVDVAESLEKRVKSRFSHRYVHLSSAKGFAVFVKACKAGVVLEQHDLTPEERKQLGDVESLIAKDQRNTAKDNDWKALIDTLFDQDDLRAHLKRIYYTTKSIPEFQASMLTPLATLPTEASTTPTSTSTLITHITTSLERNSPLRAADSKLSILPSLSTLQLALLICAARLANIHNCDAVPFAQAYDEYKVLASKAKLQASASGALAQGAGSRVSSKDVAKGAWEALAEAGLIMEDGHAGRGARVDVGLEEIGMSGVEVGSWGRWCREI